MPRKTPTEQQVLDYLRGEYEMDRDMACKDTVEIAEHFGCHQKSLYNFDKDTGPLHELWQRGEVDRLEGCRHGEFQWEAAGGRISWDWD